MSAPVSPAEPATAPRLTSSGRGLGTKVASGAAWMILMRLLERSIGVIGTLALARLLVPSDFGIVAMAMSVAAILEMLFSAQADAALIRTDDATRAMYDTSWTMNAMIGTLIAVFLLILAFPAAGFYHEPRVAPVIVVVALATFVSGLENIGVVDFRKQFHFQREFGFQMGRRLTGFVTTIALAVLFRSYWALVLGTLAGRLGGVVLSFLLSPYRPRLCLSEWTRLFGFSKWLFVHNILVSIRQTSADLITGSMLGSHALGVYRVSSEIASLPTTELVAPINRAVYPGYASIAADLRALREGFLRVIGVIAVIAIPAGAGVGATAETLVPLLLGAKWLGAIPVLKVWWIAAVAWALQTNVWPVYMALGTPGAMTGPAFVNVMVLVPMLYVGIQGWGVIGAAWALAVAQLVGLPLNYWRAFGRLGLGFADVVGVLWRPLVGTAVMYAVVRASGLVVGYDGSTLEQLGKFLVMITVGTAAYTGTVLVLWKLAGGQAGAESTLLALAKERLRAWWS